MESKRNSLVQTMENNEERLEAMEDTVHFRSRRFERQQFQASLLGPAWHDVREPSKPEPACKNVGFGRTRRFKRTYEKDVPAPGTYFLEPYKARYGPHSVLPTFQYSPPCRFKNSSPSWYLAPNRYNIIDKDEIKYLPSRIVSLKGPYRLFTPARDPSSIYNHYRTDRAYAASWPWALPGSLGQALKNKCGITSRTGRDHPPRHRVAMTHVGIQPLNSEGPGPASYSPEPIETIWKQYKYGFNSSNDKPRGYKKGYVWPAVGRYNIRKKPCCEIPGHGHRSVFKSKTKRTPKMPEKYNCF